MVNTFRIILYRMLPPSRPFLPSLSLSLSPRSSRWLGCLTSVATSRPLEGLKHRSTYFITPCQYMQYWYQIPSNPHLQFESATIWNSKATCLNVRDLFFIKIFILTQCCFFSYVHTVCILHLPLQKDLMPLQFALYTENKKLPVWIQKIFIQKLSFFDKWK